MNILDIVARSIGAFVSVATFVPYLRTDLWRIRVFDFPRMQLLVIGVVTLVFLIIRWDMREMSMTALAVVLGVALTIQSWFIFPYTTMASEQVKTAGDSDGVIGVFVANVLQKNHDAATLEQEIERSAPDIILLTETDAWWTDRMSYLERSHPYTVLHPQDNTYGMNLYSRFPLSASEVRFLIDPAIPSIHTTVRMPNGQPVLLYGVHPAPPGAEHPEQDDLRDSDDRDAELVMLAREVAKRDGPIIVAGDFNDVAWSYTTRLFQRTSRLLDPRVGRGFFNSYNAKLPLLRFPLDHLFSSDHFTLVTLERKAYFGSDHFPIFVALNLEPETADGQEAPSRKKGDAKEAREIMDRVEGPHRAR